MPDPPADDFDLDELNEFWALGDADFDDNEVNDEMANYEGEDWEDDEDEDIGGSDTLDAYSGWL